LAGSCILEAGSEFEAPNLCCAVQLHAGGSWSSCSGITTDIGRKASLPAARRIAPFCCAWLLRWGNRTEPNNLCNWQIDGSALCGSVQSRKLSLTRATLQGYRQDIAFMPRIRAYTNIIASAAGKDAWGDARTSRSLN